jgi:hypothetical protein
MVTEEFRHLMAAAFHKSFEVAAKHDEGRASLAVAKRRGDVAGRGNPYDLCDAVAGCKVIPILTMIIRGLRLAISVGDMI